MFGLVLSATPTELAWVLFCRWENQYGGISVTSQRQSWCLDGGSASSVCALLRTLHCLVNQVYPSISRQVHTSVNQEASSSSRQHRALWLRVGENKTRKWEQPGKGVNYPPNPFLFSGYRRASCPACSLPLPHNLI